MIDGVSLEMVTEMVGRLGAIQGDVDGATVGSGASTIEKTCNRVEIDSGRGIDGWRSVH